MPRQISRLVLVQEYAFTVNRGSSDGTVIVTLLESAARDDADNPSEASNSITVTVDTERPIPTITANATSPTNSVAIQYTVDFGEDVDGFVASDIGVSARGISLAVPAIVEVSAGVYEFTISHGINEGTVTAQVLPSIATDLAGNSNIASSLHEITIDRIAPIVDSASTSGSNTIVLEISETVFDRFATAADFTISGVTSTPAVTSIAVSENTVTLNLDDSITDADIPLVSYTRTDGSIEDLATNPLADFANIVATNDIDTTPPADTTSPTVTLSSEQVDEGGVTDEDTITFIAEFNEPINAATFTRSDVTVTGDSAHEVDRVQLLSELRYEIDIGHGDEDPNIAVSIASGKFDDLNGNTNTAASNTFRYGFQFDLPPADTTPPTVTISSDQVNEGEVTNIDPITLIATFDEAIDATTFRPSDVTVDGDAPHAVLSITPQSPSVYHILIEHDDDDINIDVFIASGKFDDLNGNTNTAASNTFQYGFQINLPPVDTTPPTVTISSDDVDAGGITDEDTIMLIATFDEAIDATTFTPSDVTVTGDATHDVDLIQRQSDLRYAITITHGDEDPNIAVSIATNRFDDLNGNTNTAPSNTFQYGFQFDLPPADTTPPTVTISSTQVTEGGSTNLVTANFTATFSEPIQESTFTIGDIDVSGDASLHAPLNIERENDITYNFQVQHSDDDQNINLFVSANSFDDLNGNTNTVASESFSYDFANAPVTPPVDTTPPTVIISSEQVNEGGVTDKDTITLIATFDEAIDASTFTPSDVTVTGDSAHEVDRVQLLSELRYEIDIGHGDEDPNIAVSIATNRFDDLNGNTNTAASNTFRYGFQFTPPADTTRPTITIFETTLPEPTNSTSITFTVRFSESVTGFDDISDVTITGTSGGTVNAPTGSGANYTFTVNRGATDGTITVLIPEDAARDDAGNPNTASGSVTRTIDTIPPTVTISADAQSPTNLGTIQYEASFDEIVTGVSFDDIVLEGSSETTITFGGSDDTYTYGVNHDITEGELTASVRAGAATDLAGNTNAASDPVTLTIDRVPPEVVSASVHDSRTIRLVMSEPVSAIGDIFANFAVTGLDIEADIDNIIVSGSMIDMIIDGIIADTDVLEVSYTVLENNIEDLATNPLANFVNEPITNELDTTRPTPTVSNNNVDLTNLESIPFTIRFDESVTGLVEDEITVQGPANVVPGSFKTVNATDYTFNVAHTGDGEVRVFLDPNVATDGDGNLSMTSNAVVFTFDTTPPVVTGDSIPNSNTIVLETSENVTGGVASDFTIDGVNSNPGITSIVVSENTITLNLNNAIIDTDTPTVTYAASAGSIEDLATNPLENFENRVIPNGDDAISPTIISFTTTSNEFTNAPTITYNVQFSESVTFDDTDGIDVDGTSGGTANTPTGSGASHTFTVTRGATDGTVIVSLSEGAARDDAGNPSGASDSITVTVDTVRPIPTISANATSPTNSAAIQYTVDFGETVNGFVASDIGVSARGIPLVVPPIVEVSAGVYDFTISHGINEGIVTAQVLPFIATDAAGNSNIESSLHEITIDRIAPEVESASVLDARTVRLVMSEDIIDSESSPFDFRVSGIATDPDPLSASFGDNTIDLAFEIDIKDGDDVLVLSYARTTGSINDIATNPLENFSGFTVTNELDTTPPTPTVSNGDISLTNQLSLPFTVRFDESVTGLAEDDITVQGPARVVSGSFATEDNVNYNFGVERVDSDGEITVFLAQGAAIDEDQNLSTTSNVVVFTFDTTPPVVTGDSIPNSNTIVLETSEPVTGGVASEFVITDITPALAVDTIAVSENTITLNLSGAIPVDSSLTVTYAASAGTVTDLATNPLEGFTRTISNEADTTRPTITSFTTTSNAFTNALTITYNVQFSESVTFDGTSGIVVDGESGGTANTPTGSGTSHTFTVTRGSADGTVIVSLSEGAARDDAGNPSEASNSITVTVDTERPVPTITANATELTNSVAIQYTVDFGEDVDGFVASDIGVSADGASLEVPDFETDGDTYTFTITHGIDEGDVTAQVLPFIATDAAGNSNLASSLHEITIDRVPPEVVSASVLDARTIRLVMSEPVSSTGDIFANFAVTGLDTEADIDNIIVSGSMIDMIIDGIIADTDVLEVSYTASENNIEDLATNPLANFVNEPITNELDTTRPTPTLSNNNVELTNLESIPFTIRFDESVTGLAENEITVQGPARVVPGSLATDDSVNYNFGVERTEDGEVRVFLDPNVATDGDGNLSTTSNAVVFTFDITPLVVTGDSIPDSDTIVLATSENVTGGAASEFVITGITPALAVDTIAVSENTITLNLSGAIPVDSSLTVTYAASTGTVTDLATNPLEGFTRTISNEADTTRPTITSFITTSSNPTNSQTITYEVEFSESVTFDDTDGIDVDGTSGGTANTPTGSGTEYTFTVNRGSSDGTVTVTLLESAARDDADNPSEASNPVTVTIDTVRPIPTLTANATSPTNSVAIQYTVDFGEDVDGFVASDIGVSARGISLEVPSIAEVSAGVYEFTISHGINEGNVTAQVLPFIATDAAGNSNLASSLHEITIDRVPPEVESASVLDARTVRLVMSEDIIDNGADAFDFRVSGIATDPDPLSATFGDNTIDLAFEIDIEDDDVLALSYARTTGSINDTAKNTLENFSGFTVTNDLDTTPPTPTVSNGDISLTNQSPISFTVRFDESVTGLAEDEITVNGPARVVPGSLATEDDVNYNFGVERTEDGEITVFLAQGAAIDDDGNLSTTSNVVVFTFDITPPVVTGDSIPNSNTIVLETSEPVTGGVASEFVISDITPALTVDTIEVSDNTITLNLSDNIPVDGSLTVTYAASAGTIEDLATNPLVGFTRTISNEADDTQPTITSFTTTSNAFTNAPIITYNVQFSESVTFDDASGIEVTGDSGGTANTPTGTGASHSFTVNRGSSDGTVTVTLLEGAAHDDADNPSEASNPVTVTVDTVRPIPTITANATELTNSVAIQYTVDFGETVDEFVASDVGVSARGISLAVPAIVEVSASVYEFTISHGINEGTVTAQVLPSIATDLAGNSNIASLLHEITIDRIAPIVDSASTSGSNTIVLEISETVFDRFATAADFTISGVTSTPAVTSIAVSENTVTLNLDDSITDADIPLVSYTRTDGSIEDLATNPLADFANIEATNDIDTTPPVDTTPPTVVISSTQVTRGSITNLVTANFTATFSEPIQESTFTPSDIDASGDSSAHTPLNIERENDLTYNFQVQHSDDDQNISLFVSANSFEDLNGNTNTGTSPSFTYDFANAPVTPPADTTPPTVTLSSEDVDEGGVTDEDTITLIAEFDEPINAATFTRSDVTVTGDSAHEVDRVQLLSELRYEIDIGHGDADPNIAVSIASGTFDDLNENTNTAASNTFRYGFQFAPPVDTTPPADTTRPTITIFETALPEPTNSTSITFTVRFSESVTGFDDISDVTITGTSGGTANAPTGSGADYTFTVNRGATDGTITVLIPEDAARDDAGNPNTASGSVTRTIDTMPPTVTISADAQSPTNLGTIQYEASFDETITGVSFDDIVLEGSSETTITFGGSDDTYTYGVNHDITEGELTASVRAGAATDLAGNTNTASDPVTLTIDRVPPEVVSASVLDARTVRLVMSEPVSATGDIFANFAVTGLDIEADIDNIIVSGSMIDMIIDGIIADTDVLEVSYTVLENNIEDLATNPLANFVNEPITNELDTTRPTPTLSNNNVDLTNLESIPFTIRFDESVTGLAEDEITVQGPAIVVPGSLVTDDSVNYNFGVERTEDGEVRVFLDPNVATDGDGNLSMTSNAVVFTFDTTPPVVTGDSIPNSNTIVLETSENVTGGAASEFVITGITPALAVDTIAVSENTITLNLSGAIPVDSSLTVTYAASTGTVTDLATNPLEGFTREVSNEADDTSPTIISFETTSNEFTNAATITYNVQFSESVTGFSAAGISVGGTSGGTAAEPTGNGAEYAFTVTRGASDGTVTVSIREDAARDDADNPSEASNPVTVTIDTVRPIPTITANATSPTNSVAIQYTVDFGEDVDGFVASDIGVSARGTSLEVPDFETDGDTYTFTITHGIDEGNVTAQVLPFIATDLAGNTNAASDPVTLTIDRVPPEVESASVLDVRTVRLVMSEDIIDSESSPFDFRVSGIATDPDPLSATFDDNTIDLAFEIDIEDDDVLALSYARTTGSINDTAKNTLENFSGFTVTNELDTTPPTPTLSNDGITLTNQLSLPFTVRFDESVTGLAEDEITVNGPARVVPGSLVTEDNVDYTFDVERVDSDGEITVFIAQGAAIDEDQNPSTTSNVVEFTFDTVAPTVTGDSIPDSNTIVLEISEDVTGGNEADFTIGGVAPTPVVTSIAVSENTITLSLDASIAEGDSLAITYAASAGSIEDLATNPLAGFTRTISNEADDTLPTVTSFTTTSNEFTNALTITYNVVFSESVTFDGTSGIVVDGESGGTANTPTGSGTSYTFTVTRGASDGQVIVSLSEGAARDDADNPSEASNSITVTVDTERPIPIITANATSPTNSAAIQYTVDFGEDVDEFVASDIGVSADGISLEVPAIVKVSAGVYDFTISHGINEGNVTAQVLPFIATDVAGNSNIESSLHEITIDRIAPTVTGANVVNPNIIRLDLSEPISDDDAIASDFTIAGTASNHVVSSLSASGSTVELSLTLPLTDADNPTVSYTRTAGEIEDAAENRLANFVNEPVTNNIDTTRPSVTSFTTTSSNPTNSQTITYNVQFSESVTGFSAAGIDVTGTSGGTAAEPTGSERDYEFVVTRGVSDGTVTVTIMEGAARDADDNLSFASTPVEITVDATPPTVTGASVSDTDTIMLEISEPVSGGAASDFTINGVASGPSVSSINIAGSTVTLELNGLITDADVPLVSYTGTVDIEDPAENPLADFANESVTNNLDTTRPTVTSFTTTSSDPTNSQTIMYRVEFSESVTGFSAAGIDVRGTSGGTANEPTGTGRDYEFTVNRGSSDGTVTVTILEGAARDADDNLSFASTPVEVTVDATPPTVTAASVVNPNTIRLDLSEPISDNNAVASDFAIAGAASNHVVSSIAASGSSIELSLAPSLTDSDNPTVSYTRTAGGIEDPATNRLANFAGFTVTNDIDTTAPTPTLSTDIDSPTNLAVIPYMVNFGEAVSDFDRGDIDASIDGASLTASEPVTSDDITYTFTVTHNVNEGELRVSIRAGAATDMDSNTSTASNTISRIIDRIAPTVTGASVSDTDTIILEISELLSESESVGVTSDFTISGVATNPSVSSIDITGSTITLNLNSLITDVDNPVISYTGTAGSIEDPATNPLAAFTDRAVENEIDTTRPTVTDFTTTSSDPTNSQTITYAVQFSESVTGFSAAGISVGGTSGGTAAEPTGAGINYEFVVTRGVSDGTVTVTILEGAARDADDNLSFASSPVEIVVDATPPTVTGASVSDTDTIMLEISEPVSGGAASDFTINGVASGPSVSSINIAGSTVTLELNGLITDADVPLVSYTGTVDIEDPAENPLADFASQIVSNDLDTTRPTVTSFTTTSSNPTNSQTIMYEVQFSEPVTGFSAAGISVTGTSGGTAAEPTGAGRDYTFTVTRGSSDGTVTVTILENAARDADDNLSFASSPVEIIVDATPPTVTGALVLDSRTIQLDLSESVMDDNANAGDFLIDTLSTTMVVLVNSISVSGNSMNLTLDAELTDADEPTVSYTRTAGEIEDAATNRLANFVNQAVTNNIDTTGPVPVISTESPADSLVIEYTVDFGGMVNDFVYTDILAFIDEKPLPVSNPVFDVGSMTYTFSITHGVDEGTVMVSIPPDAVTDTDGNLNTASVTHMHTINRVGPVTMLSTTDMFPTNNGTVQFRVNFTETVTFEVNTISVGGVTLDMDNPGFTIMLDSPSSTNVDTSMGPGRDFNFTLMYDGTDGTVPVYIPANSVMTEKMIGNMESNMIDAEFDFTDPEVTGVRMMDPTTIQLSMSEPVNNIDTVNATDFKVTNMTDDDVTPEYASSITTSGSQRLILHFDQPIPEYHTPEVRYNQTMGFIKDNATNTLKDFARAFSTSGDDGVDNTKWRTKATFGISYSHGEKLVDCGYSMDKLCRDVLDYHVDYQRQSITTNSTHDYTLKTYAPNGLRFLGIAFGVPSIGAPLSSAEAQIRVDLARDYDIPSTYLIENVEYINENNVIGQNATFEISRVQCLPTDERHDCVLLNINDVLFREQLYYEPFVISAMDSNRYATVHFMNDGILVSGDSLNEAPTHDLTAKLAHQRDLAQLTLTRTDKLSDVWTDQYGHTWTKNSFGTWSYVEVPKITVRPSCTDIDDRVCEAFGKKLDWHTTNMENLRDSLYGDIYTTPAFDSLTEVITIHDVDGDSRAAFLAESAYYLLE